MEYNREEIKDVFREQFFKLSDKLKDSNNSVEEICMMIDRMIHLSKFF